MKFLRFVGIFLVCTLLAACANSPQIRTDFDPKADFSAYKSFAFVQPPATVQAGYTSFLTERLKSSVTVQMQSRGYVLNEQSPDLLINFYTQTRQRTDYIAPPPMPWGPYYYGYRFGYYSDWAGYAMPPEVIQYTEGILNIDLIDARRKQLVWEGISTSVINDFQQATSEASVAAVVAAIFAKYPFMAGSNVQLKPAEMRNTK